MEFADHRHTGVIVGIPTNVWGTQATHSGKAYASFIVYIDAGGYVGEYLEVPLTSTLVAGETYDVSFWVSLCDTSRWAIAELGAYLSVGSVSTGSGTTPLPYTPQIQNPSTNILTNKTGWVQIAGTFTAAGGETHLVLGNFKSGTVVTKQNVGGLHKWANYYIDDVNVSKASSGGLVPTPQLVGWSDRPLPTTPGYIDLQDVDSNCKPATTRCRTLSLTVATADHAGGTSCDPRYQTVWASDSLSLAEFHLDPQKSCNTELHGGRLR